MFSQGYTVKNPINILIEDEIQRIHLGVLDILEKTGVVFDHKEALAILKEAGCSVDPHNKRVKFPGYLVEECLRKCPSSFTLKGRDPKYDLRVGDPFVYFSSFSGKEYINLETLEIRPPTARELGDAWRVLDCLDGLHYAGYAYGSVEGVTGPFFYPYRASIVARNTTKPGCGWIGGTHGTPKWSMQIFSAAGITPLGSSAASPPLTWYSEPIEILLDCARAGFPLKPVSGLAAGANAPATLAGALVQNCAEVISAIVLAQIVRPGIPILAQDYSQPFDMRTGAVVQGGIERGLMGAAWSQIWRNYGIPRITIISSDAKVPDYQCAMEKVMSATLHAMAGSNVICFMGAVYDELIFSPVVAVIDNDVVHMVGRILQGIHVNPQTLAVDLIEQVGPIPGQFLDKKHTRDTWRQEQLIPQLADRLSYPEWEKKGRKDILARAREKCEEILSIHKPMPLSQAQENEIEKILKDAKRYLEEKGAL